MNPASKKFISLFLIFSLLTLSANLYAKEKRGAKLIVTKADGQQIKGELITIKKDSLLLLDIEGKDMAVGIGDIKVIRIVKKQKVLVRAGVGVLIFGGAGALFGRYGSRGDPQLISINVPIFGLIGAGIGFALGVISGLTAGTDKTIQIEGMTDSEIQGTLDKLRKKARIRDYK